MPDRIRKSFKPFFSENPLQDPIWSKVVATEYDIFKEARKRLEDHENGTRKLAEGKCCSPSETYALALFHGMAAFLNILPDSNTFMLGDILLPESIYRITSLTRHLKYFEAQGILKQASLNGDKLLLGCGQLFTEAYVLSTSYEILDPSKLIDTLLQDLPSDTHRAMIELKQAREKYIRSLKRYGRIVGIDHDNDYLGLGGEWCKKFLLPTEPRVEDAGEFLEKDNRTFDLIGIIRLDPLMIGLHPEAQKAFLLRLFDKLNRGGQILITIGSGNSPEEFKEREHAIRYLSKVGEKNGFSVFQHKNKDDPNTKKWNNGGYMDLQTLIIS